MIREFLTFSWREKLGNLNIRLGKYESSQEKIGKLSQWLGKEPATLLLLHLLKRINQAFLQEQNGWKYQDLVLVSEVNEEMRKLLQQGWEGVPKVEEVIPTINE